MIQTQSEPLTPPTIGIFVMLKSIDIAELLFQKHCPGYAMSVTTSTNILCISHSFFCKHLSKSQTESCGKGKMQAETLQTCFGEDEMQIKSKSISILKYLKGHTYIKMDQTLNTGSHCYMWHAMCQTTN